jgi:hypothetical protein
MVNLDIGDYFKNPLANVVINIENEAVNLQTLCSYNTIDGVSPIPGLETIYYAAGDLQSTANDFFYHTQRLSGVITIHDDLLLNVPHYQTAVSYGKAIIYLLGSHDGLQNNAPVIGNFTSLFLGPYLANAYTTMVSDYNRVANSIIHGTVPSTNLTNIQVSTITANTINVSSNMSDRQNSDTNFFIAEQNLIQNSTKFGSFNNIGQSENFLIQNFVGSEKLLSRLNSQ